VAAFVAAANDNTATAMNTWAVLAMAGMLVWGRFDATVPAVILQTNASICMVN
jgi:hypothetical protein